MHNKEEILDALDRIGSLILYDEQVEDYELIKQFVLDMLN